MNNRKTLEILNKLANQLDEIGRQPEANFVDQMISKLAQETLAPIGKPYKDGDKFYQKFDAGSKGLVVREVNPDGTLKEQPAAKPLDKMTPTHTAPQSEETWEAWFRRKFPGMIPALQSKPEEAIQEQQNANQAKDDKGENKVEKLIQEIQERYNRLRETGWTPPKKLQQAEVVEYEDPDEEETEIMEWEDPDSIPTRMDLISNVDFENMPDFTGEKDWADVSMWQDGKPVDNRF